MGVFWGMLLGLFIAMPIVGAAVGAGLGAMRERVFDERVEDGFIKSVKDFIEMKQATLFIRLIDVSNEERVLETITAFKGKVLKSHLLADDEAEPKGALGDV
jgi:uncharacterized membrane protein